MVRVLMTCEELQDYMYMIESELLNINLKKHLYTSEQYIYFRGEQEKLLEKWHGLHKKLCVAYNRNFMYFPQYIKDLKNRII